MKIKVLIKKDREYILRITAVILMVLAVIISGVSPANAEDKANYKNVFAGKIISARGNVYVVPGDGKKTFRAKNGQALNSGDSVRTGRNGRASLLMSDETMMRQNRNSVIKVGSVTRNAGWIDRIGISGFFKSISRSVYTVISGKVWARNKNKEVDVQFKTITATIGIRGTELAIEVTDDGVVKTTVMEGSVEVVNDQGSVIANTNEMIIAEKGKAPHKTVLLDTSEAVQWTLVIPPLFEADMLSGTGRSQVSELINKEDYSAASKEVSSLLVKAPDDINLQVVDAILDVYNGNPRAANKKLSILAGQKQGSDLVFRSLAMTQLMLGNNAEAQVAAEKSVQIKADNVANQLVTAYVSQAMHDLERAGDAAQKALSIDVENTLAMLILAQTQFGSGYTDDALDTLRHARKTGRYKGQVENLAGFVLLAKRKHEEAKTAFNNSIKADASQSEPYLGLGLLSMREGRTDEALENVTTAVAQDPQRAMYLSYWGKMLHQVQRYDKALDVFDQAAELDSEDPTPAFYKSMVLRDLNRPGESIASLNKAIELNDNRGVYRSSFMLDKDLAVRNVDLSALYEKLGMSAWAQNRALASIKDDYTNYSAHLFYGGALAQTDDRTYSASSEFLLARLMMPANVNTFNSFNDYTSFYEQPSFNGEVEARVGNNKTAGLDLLTYGSNPDSNFAWSAGLFAATTDGYREDHFEEFGTAALLGKWNINEEDSILLTANFLKLQQGDEDFPRYEFDVADPVERQDSEIGLVEFGYHNSLTPESDLLVYLNYTNFDGEAHNRDVLVVSSTGSVETFSNNSSSRPFGQFQLQYMNKLADHQLIVGTVNLWGENEIDLTGDTFIFPAGTSLLPFAANNKIDISYNSAYLQDIWDISDAFTLEAAVYYETLETGAASINPPPLWKIEEINPRLGLIITPNESHTFRLAAFRYLLPFATTGRVDPVDIAGVAIFRNTAEGALVDEADIVWEYSWSKGFVSVNGYHVKRELQVATNTFVEDRTRGVDLLGNFLLTNTIGLNAKYQFQKIETPIGGVLSRNGVLTNDDRDDHLASLGLRYVPSNGFSAGILQTYRQMDLETREKETANITDFDLAYEYGDKSGVIRFQMLNVFEDEFNWITNAYTIVGRDPARAYVLSVSKNF